MALPFEAINAASAREKSIRHGHPSTLRAGAGFTPWPKAKGLFCCAFSGSFGRGAGWRQERGRGVFRVAAGELARLRLEQLSAASARNSSVSTEPR